MQLSEEIVGVTKARERLPANLHRFEQGSLERVVIVRHSNPVAVMLPMEVYERMMALEAQREEIEDAHAILDALKRDDGSRISLDDIKREFDID